MDFEDLLLSDKGSDDEKEKPKPKEKKSLIVNFGPINIDKSTESEKDNPPPVLPESNKNIIPINQKNVQENIKAPPKTNNLLDFVLGNVSAGGSGAGIEIGVGAGAGSGVGVAIQSQNQSNKSNHSKQVVKSNPSSFSNQSLENNIIEQKIKEQTSLHMNNQTNLNITVDERKFYENKIDELNKQREQIDSEYTRSIEQKKKEYNIIEERNRKEREELEIKNEKKINDQKNLFEEKKERYNNQKNLIEKEKKEKLKEIKEFQDMIFKQKMDQIESDFNIERQKIEQNHQFELDKLQIELDNIKETKDKIFQDEISNQNLENLYNTLYNKINSVNNDIEHFIELKENDFLQKELESKNMELCEEIKKIKDNDEMYDRKIKEILLQKEEIKEKFEKEKKELKQKEYEIMDNELKIKNNYNQKNIDLDNIQKDMEIKFYEESNLYNLDKELINEENILNQEKELFEKEKKETLKMFEEKNNKLKKKADAIKQYEL